MTSYDVSLKDLKLNCRHWRMVPQADEESALRALARDDLPGLSRLLSSFLNYGYLPHCVVIATAGPDGTFRVLDGNRRMAVLKYAHGLLKGAGAGLPARRMTHAKRETSWRIPALVFTPERLPEALEIIGKIHAADRYDDLRPWPALARARFGRACGTKSHLLELTERLLATLPEAERNGFAFEVWSLGMERAARVLKITSEVLARDYPARHGVAVDTLFLKVASGQLFAETVNRDAITWLIACGFIDSPLGDDVIRA